MSGAKGDGVIEDWTWEVVRVEGDGQSERATYLYAVGILINASGFQFAYYVFSLRDTLGQLTGQEEITAVQQVFTLYDQSGHWS